MAFSSIAKDFNKESIVQAVRDFEYYTKQELSQRTSLSFPTTLHRSDARRESTSRCHSGNHR